jgi:hypothetical protein
LNGPRTIATECSPSPDKMREGKAALAKAERRATEKREFLIATAKLISESGSECLESSTLTDNERKSAIDNCERFDLALKTFDAILAGISSPIRRADLRHVMGETIWAAFFFGRTSPPFDMIVRMEKRWKTAHMREERAAKPEEVALWHAILRSLPNKVVEQPKKMAVALLNLVNAELARDNFPPVSIDKVNRRLIKLRDAQRSGSALFKSAPEPRDILNLMHIVKDRLTRLRTVNVPQAA